MKVFCKEFITVWTRELVSWLSRKFDSISIDLTPVEDKLDEVKSDVADVKTSVEHIDFSTLAKQGTNPAATNTAILEAMPSTTGLATEANATSNKQSIIDAINSVQPDLSSVAKEAAATANKQAIIEALSAKIFASAEDNALTLYMYSLKQLEDMTIKTSAGDVKFTIVTDQQNYYLSYSSDSPLEIAGQAIEDDAAYMYDQQFVFGKNVFTFPDGWTINGVFLYSIDGNLLGEGDAWRLADMHRKAAKEQTLGASEDQSVSTTVFGWLKSIRDFLVGIVSTNPYAKEATVSAAKASTDQVAAFFNLPQTLPSGYHAMTEAEVLEIADEVWDAMYGFVAVPNTVHTIDASESERVFTTYMNPTKTYADYGWPALWDAQGVTIPLTDHPTANRVIYTFNPSND